MRARSFVLALWQPERQHLTGIVPPVVAHETLQKNEAKAGTGVPERIKERE
ncbi:MAG: hypothetical protein OEU87_02910 [Nitrospira sp.]|nr:hypothetical protein [Nitrospira sp.]